MTGSASTSPDVKLLRRLVKQIDGGHYEAARRTCTKRVVLFIHLLSLRVLIPHRAL